MTIPGAWWNQPERPVLFGVADEVDSCMLTTPAKTHSVLVFLEAATSTEAPGQIQPCSTANIVWRPLEAVVIRRIQHISQGPEEMATCDNFVLYGNAGTCLGGISLHLGTTNPPRYTRTGSGALIQTALEACTNVLARRFSSTCSVQARAAFQIDYLTVD